MINEMPGNKGIQFFLGSNTKRGFVPLFDELRNPVSGYRLYILKGGPGSGKSSLMRRIAKALEEQGHDIEYIPCASDPQSLDAILDYDSHVSIVDGTAPHTMDPAYPGAYDVIINLGDVWNQDLLMQNKKRIMELSDIIGKCHSMATTCITSAAVLLENNRALAEPYINQDEIRVSLQQLMKELNDSPAGQEKKRLLSAVSVGETVFFDDTLTSLCPKLYSISDDWGASSGLLLSLLHDFAVSKNVDVITCYCSIRTPDKIDHLLFPSAGFGITTMNSFHSTASKDCIPVDGLMFPIDCTILDGMNHNLTMAKQLIETAGKHVARAKQLHDDLEAFYIKAMDFSKVDEVYDKMIREILTV